MKSHTTRLKLSALLLGTACIMATGQRAWAATVYDNGGPLAGGNALQISSAVTANDFSLTEETTLTGFTFWAGVNSSTTTFAANFSGTIGWAIFTDNINIPGNLLFSGNDTNVLVTDAGIINLFDGEVVEIDVDLPADLTLAAGSYWLALRDGEWGSTFDIGEIFWQQTSNITGDPIRVDTNEASPSTWSLASDFDGAFLIEGRVNNDNPGGGNPGGGDPGNGDPGTPGNIPEPATAALGLIALATLSRRRAGR